jgi:hypothetical protein
MTPEEALAKYQAMTKPELRSVLVLEYRCGHDRPGCLLLHVWNTPQGRLYYLPRYRLSPKTATTEVAESARRKRTEDGFRVLRSRAGSFDEILADYACEPDSGLPMNCEHLRNVNVMFERLAADAEQGQPGRHAARRVARDGTVTR